MNDVIIIGSGPCGLSAAIEAKRAGLNPLVIEKHCMVYSIYSYPTHLQFFSTAELLEIGGYPFITPNDKPFRQEALVYYRTVALRENLAIKTYEEVTLVERRQQHYEVHTVDRFGRSARYESRFVILATGYFDQPNLLGITGEELPKVTHYYREAHPYTGMKVAIIGGSNSAVDAAMDLLRVGAEVTIVYRGAQISSVIKPWVRPIFESMVNKGKIRMLFDSQVQEITESSVRVNTAGVIQDIPNDFVLALTGFRPDRTLLTSLGIDINEETGAPYYNPETMETNVKGFYVAGVVASSKYDANEIFIETGRKHGNHIASHMASSLV
ncbi:YpdA family putative bacillithiol disulfide reductase [Paenibacillus eucommiae]|uniref:Thioredoxin reductase (NADPH) n=1 Tax=Paenibacillus eucommiae TaxID=1355755 RepID=A0ABS4J8A2_9BACL|nr:YpdA family putative bacillithiol disulfide reductase [Paenibacillus eucommiae]MBP1995306.1 thioredoxin reductase (NADPH) [Paenibacillus eucommiae]